jgi:signal transduction histidine kinase
VIAGGGAANPAGWQSYEELRAFGAGLLMAQENERQKLALELHDDLNQRLALLELNVETIEKAGPRNGPEWKEQLHSVHEQITSLSQSLRQIAYQLHPAALEHLGLAQAVETFVRDFSEREHVDVRFRAEDLPGAIDPQAALCLYRSVQESLRNVAQHSAAKSAEVLLARRDGVIQLRIKDGGLGFELIDAKSRGRLGLRSMEERARACGGTFKITTRPGAGTEVVVEIPDKLSDKNGPAK